MQRGFQKVQRQENKTWKNSPCWNTELKSCGKRLKPYVGDFKEPKTMKTYGEKEKPNTRRGSDNTFRGCRQKNLSVGKNTAPQP